MSSRDSAARSERQSSVGVSYGLVVVAKFIGAGNCNQAHNLERGRVIRTKLNVACLMDILILTIKARILMFIFFLLVGSSALSYQLLLSSAWSDLYYLYKSIFEADKNKTAALVSLA